MNNEELGTVVGVGDYRRVEVNRIVNAPIAAVWKAITDPEEASMWAGPCEIDPREGGRITMHSTDCDNTGKGLDGTIKVFMPPHVLEYTWNDNVVEGGLVRYDLVEIDSTRTRITLINTLNSTNYASAAAGWHEMLERLDIAVVSGEAVPEDEARGRELYAIYETALSTN